MELNRVIDEVNVNDIYDGKKFIEERRMKDFKRVEETNNVLREFKILFVKNLAVMIGTAACAYFKLLHPILYVPIEILCLCAICFKYGEWKGRIDGE